MTNMILSGYFANITLLYVECANDYVFNDYNWQCYRIGDNFDSAIHWDSSVVYQLIFLIQLVQILF